MKNCLKGNAPRLRPAVLTDVSNCIHGSVLLIDQGRSYCLRSYFIPLYEDFIFLDKGKG